MLHTTTTTRNVPGHITRTYKALQTALQYGDQPRATHLARMLLHPNNATYLTAEHHTLAHQAHTAG